MVGNGTLRGFERRLETLGLMPLTRKAYVRDVELFQSYLEENGGAGLTRQSVERWLGTAALGPSSITRKLAAIKAWARFLGIPDPTQGIPRPKRREALPRPLDGVVEAIARADPQTRAIATLFRETGLRLAEACRLSVPLPITDDFLAVEGKGGRPRVIPLNRQARDALESLGGRIPISPRAVQRRLNKVGMTAMRLRHTHGTELAQTGADLGDIQELLGHASPATTKGYARYSLDRLRAAVERRQRVFGTTGIEESNWKGDLLNGDDSDRQ